MATTQLDLKGLKCPLPVLRANKALKDLAPSHILEILVTDPSAPKDFESYCETTGHRFAGSKEDKGVYTVVIQKKD